MLSLVMIASSETDSSRTIGAVVAGVGLNDISAAKSMNRQEHEQALLGILLERER